MPKRPPASFLPPKWRKLIFATGVATRRLYETAVLPRCATVCGGSDIWVAGSRDYRAFEDYLLPAEAARHGGVDQESNSNDRAAALHERLNFVMARAARGELDGVEIEEGRLARLFARRELINAARGSVVALMQPEDGDDEDGNPSRIPPKSAPF